MRSSCKCSRVFQTEGCLKRFRFDCSTLGAALLLRLVLLLEELRVELNGLFIAALFQLQLMKCRVVNTNTQAGTT